MDMIQGLRNRKQGIGTRKCSTWNIFILLSLVSSLLLNYQQGFEKISEVSAQMSVVSSQFSVPGYLLWGQRPLRLGSEEAFGRAARQALGCPANASD
jgi:hypothetical protein